MAKSVIAQSKMMVPYRTDVVCRHP